MKSIAFAAALAAVAQPVMAQSVSTTPEAAEVLNLTRPSAGHTYFYRAGASIDAHDAAVRECGLHAGRMTQPQDSSAAVAGAAGGLLGALVVGIVSGVIQGQRNTRALAANVENCMVVDGWEVRRLEAAEGERLDELEQPALHDAMALRIGAVPPMDERARVFGDELMHQQPVMFGWPGDMDAMSLSIQGLPKLEPVEAEPRARLPRQERTARSPRALAENRLLVAPTTGLVIVQLNGLAEHGGRSLTFVRAGADTDTPAWVADQQPDRFVATLTTRAAARGDQTRSTTAAFAVPPGRWRLASITQNLFTMSLCRGAPAFDLKAGEAGFAGAFDMSGAFAAPSTAVEQATLPAAYSALSPTPVVWSDGGPAACEGAYLYAVKSPAETAPELQEAAMETVPVAEAEVVTTTPVAAETEAASDS